MQVIKLKPDNCGKVYFITFMHRHHKMTDPEEFGWEGHSGWEMGIN
jgi:hypothetical protein